MAEKTEKVSEIATIIKLNKMESRINETQFEDEPCEELKGPLTSISNKTVIDILRRNGAALKLVLALAAANPLIANSAEARPGRGQSTEIVDENNLYQVDIEKLRENILRNGVLVLTHNGMDGVNVKPGEDEYYRISEAQSGSSSLGRNTQRGYLQTTKKLSGIQGINSNGEVITINGNVTVHVIDMSYLKREEMREVSRGDCGDTHPQYCKYSQEEAIDYLEGQFGNKKFGLILVAGHVFNIEELIEVSKHFRAPESLTLLGGCRTAQFIPGNFRNNALMAGSSVGIATERYTHLMRSTIAAILGRQFGRWEDYPRIMARYSGNIGTEILPGSASYRSYIPRR